MDIKELETLGSMALKGEKLVLSFDKERLGSFDLRIWKGKEPTSRSIELNKDELIALNGLLKIVFCN